MSELIKDFNNYRFKTKKNILKQDDFVMNRVFNLEAKAYNEGALTKQTKELLGLVASTVLRCDDSVKHHLQACYKEGLNKKEIIEALGIATLVGGTIVVPQIRKGLEFWEALELE